MPPCDARGNPERIQAEEGCRAQEIDHAFEGLLVATELRWVDALAGEARSRSRCGGVETCHDCRVGRGDALGVGRVAIGLARTRCEIRR